LADVKKQKIKRGRDKLGSRKKITWNNKPNRKKNKGSGLRKYETDMNIPKRGK
jgi:hypothetical protein